MKAEEKKEFTPFNEEWKKEMMKLNKSDLIDEFLTPSLKKNIILEIQEQRIKTLKETIATMEEHIKLLNNSFETLNLCLSKE